VNAWLVVLVAGLGSYALRISMITSDRLRLPPRLERSADMVAPAAFAALAMTGLATAAVAATTLLAALPLVLGFAAAVTATARTGRPYAALIGLPVYWLASVPL
jgi:branched-subunit amino acid transport protein